MANSSDPCNCPSCGKHGDHKQLDAPAFKVIGGCSPPSFSYNLGKNMEKAKQMRAVHEEKFGKHEEYVQGSPGSRRVIDSDSVTVHGDIGGSLKEREDVINRKAAP